MTTLIKTRISGIPCTIDVLTARYTKPDRSTWASDLDYYGGWEIEFEVCDRKGRPAPWLAKKLTDNDIARIEEEIKEAERPHDIIGEPA